MSVTYKNALILLIASLSVFTACKYRSQGPGHGEKPIISFKSVEGITFIEVSRRQKSNGLSYNEYGYHLTPDWRLRFVSSDSAALYSPQKDAYYNFPLALGTDSVFNIAHAFLKMKKISKDSLVFDLLEAQGDSIDIHKSRVVMKLYSEPYIKKTGKDLKQLQAAGKKDTLFVRGLVNKANADIKKAFAAANPVQLISKNPNLQVTKRKTKPSLLDNKYATDDDYLTPTYDILIHKAYQDFDYSFEATVDSAGVWHYNKPLVPFLGDEDVKANYIKVSTAIMNTYLKMFMTTIPGETLGMKQASTISVNVKGIKAAK